MAAYNSSPYHRKPLTVEDILALIPPAPIIIYKIYEPIYINGEQVLSSSGDIIMAYGGNNAS